MKKIKELLIADDPSARSEHERGVALIVVLWVLGFMLSVGIVLLTVTSTGPKVSGNMRWQQQAFNAAEAGFDVGWSQIEEYYANSDWHSFEGHYLAEPTGIDDPQSDNYFRKLTDLELLNLIDPDEDGTPNLNTVIFCRQPYIQKPDSSFDLRYTYTVFLIDDEAGAGTSSAVDTVMVCIGTAGTGYNMTTTRIEIEMAIELTE